MPGHTAAYYGIGRRALHVIGAALINSPDTKYSKILDFPCGWGRVTRWIRAGFPEAEIGMAEIVHEASRWCAEQFGGVPILSHPNFNEVSVDDDYDIIWVGSLVTHLPEDKAIEFFRFASSKLTPNGVLIVTLHGRRAVANGRAKLPATVFRTMEEMEREALKFESGKYGYGEYLKQPGYGHSFSPLPWVYEAVSSLPEISVLSFREKGWNNHQDVLVLKRAPI